MKNVVNGALWKTTKSNARSPDLLGKVQLNQDLLSYLNQQMKTGKAPTLQIACWSSVSGSGNKYYRVEATPYFPETVAPSEPVHTKAKIGLEVFFDQA